MRSLEELDFELQKLRKVFKEQFLLELSDKALANYLDAVLHQRIEKFIFIRWGHLPDKDMVRVRSLLATEEIKLDNAKKQDTKTRK